MADRLTSITDLPLDILVLIFPYLDAKSFLSLCSTCKAFQQPSISLDPAYWSYVTRSTFRVPNQPVVQHDGLRWQKMYRRLLTQSHAFTWGSNTHSRLGHSYADDEGDIAVIPRFGRPGRRRFNNMNCSFPTEMEDTRNLGVIADMQCGGWSTTLLTSRGTLYTVGVLDGQIVWNAVERLQPLEFPAGYPTPKYDSSAQNPSYEEPAIAVRQFSAGRSHILAASDTGRIWSWYDVKSPALQIKFADLEIKEIGISKDSIDTASFGRAKQVVAGWSLSSAYIYGIGIVIWDPVQRDHDDDTVDTMLILEHTQVPNTGAQRAKDRRPGSTESNAADEEVGFVLNYIMLEHFVVFVTDIGKVFCAKFGDKHKVDEVLEIKALRNEQQTHIDVQGSFRRFAIFKNGEVITSDQDYLEALWTTRTHAVENIDSAGLHKIPALQQRNVISVAFGDYHYLALHSNGKITSYGKELGACGALGLGSEADDEGLARGIVYDRFSHDGSLLPHAAINGREVWFDSKKKDWLHHLMQGGKDPEESEERRELFRSDHNVQGQISEWIEQESREWDNMQLGDDGLGAHFALRVSAAGWHSGAVVLVNKEIAEQEPTYSYVEQSFPRIRLVDGTEMPGLKDFDDWRERPEYDFGVDH